MRTAVKIFILSSAVFAGSPDILGDVRVNGKPVHEIVISASAGKYEKLAAGELAEILLKMTGSSLKIVGEEKFTSKRNAIHIGETSFAKSAGLHSKNYGREEWELKTVGNDLVIQGGFPVGALYGVYALLEKYGVYFLSFDQSAIPRIQDLDLKDLNERRKPAFDGRSIYTAFIPASRGNKFDRKNIAAEYRFRLRNMISSGDDYKGIYDNIRFGSHTFYYYVSPKEYFKTHPEYFSMNEQGKRFVGKISGWQGGQLCLSNRDVREITLASLRKFIREDRSRLPKEEWPLIYDLSQMDNTDYICKCPKCREIIEEEGCDAGLLLRYVNHVAKEIRKEYPDISLRTFAYVSTEKVPKITKPEKNVIIFFCDVYSYSDPFKPLEHAVNKKQLAKLKAWTRIGTPVMFWDYWNFFENFPARLDDLTDATSANMKLLRGLGVKALFNEAERGFVSPQSFFDYHFFIAAQLMRNPDADLKKLTDIFFRAYYGPAEKEVRRYYERLRTAVSKEQTPKYWVNGVCWRFATSRFVMESYDLLKQAEKKIPRGRDAFRRRVHEEMIPVLLLIVGNPETVSMFRKKGIERADLVRELKDCMEEYRMKYAPASDAYSAAKRKRILSAVESNIPVPEKFKSVPSNQLFIIGHPFYRRTSPEYMKCSEDPDACSGKTFRIIEHDPKTHRIEAQPAWRDSRFFGIHNFDIKGTGGSVHIGEIPQDEKYHWYCIRNAKIGSGTWFWGMKWMLSINISHAYILSDGNKDINTRDVWFNVKYEGPAYVRGSKKENALCVELVVVTPPGAVK